MVICPLLHNIFILQIWIWSIEQWPKSSLVKKDTIVFLLEPFHRVGFCDSVFESHSGLLSATVGNVVSRSGKHNIEIHSVDTDAGIVLDAEIDVFSNTETEISSFREVASFQLVLFHFQALFKNFFGLGSPNSAMNCNFLITSDTERSNSESCFGEHWCLTGKCFQNFTSTHQSVTTFTNTDVDAQFLDSDFLHLWDLLRFLFLSHFDFFFNSLNISDYMKF